MIALVCIQFGGANLSRYSAEKQDFQYSFYQLKFALNFPIQNFLNLFRSPGASGGIALKNKNLLMEVTKANFPSRHFMTNSPNS